MKSERIEPARLGFEADGRPRSLVHDDIYSPRQGALAQAQQVFLAGNGLPERWHGRDRFVVLETGFGFGNNFLATWDAWRRDPKRSRQLHYIGVELHPPTRESLASSGRESSLSDLARELAAAWPPSTFDLHQLDFADGAVRLSLAFGSVAAWLPQLVATVDAFFLDGFAPARNPEMWEPRVYKALARLAAPGATAATWSAAVAVRSGLRAAGFAVELAAGSGGKRDITLARYAPAFAPRRSARAAVPVDASSADAEPVVIIGAGMAGCAIAAALARAGRRSLLLERRAEIAGEGSGNDVALFHGVVHADDGRHARFFRAAALRARAVVARLLSAGEDVGAVGGVLRLATKIESASSLREVADRLGLPADYALPCDAAAAGDIAGIALASPAWLYPGGGWVAPRRLAAALLREAGAACESRTDVDVASIRAEQGRWTMLDSSSRTVTTASTIVLASAGPALLGRLGAELPLFEQKALVSSLPRDAWPGSLPRMPLVGDGYLSTEVDGRLWFGASAVGDDAADRLGLDPIAQAANVARLSRMVPEVSELGSTAMGGRQGSRWTTPDRLPLIGTIADPAALTTAARLDQPRLIGRLAGLCVCLGLGSRGVANALLGADIVAATICGAPQPLPADLLDAVDPARFLSRSARRDGGLQPPLGPIDGGSAGT